LRPQKKGGGEGAKSRQNTEKKIALNILFLYQSLGNTPVYGRKYKLSILDLRQFMSRFIKHFA
jgi:hypothetical protein